jgi:hypothetical protein
MKCLVCPLKYLGQAESIFNNIYEERVQAIGNNNRDFAYSNHTLNIGHTCGIMSENMCIIKTGRKRNI